MTSFSAAWTSRCQGQQPDGGAPKEAMVCAFIVMKCEGFTQITDLMDYLDNNRIIAHYCGFNIMEPLPSY